jgi:hypothetical protein
LAPGALGERDRRELPAERRSQRTAYDRSKLDSESGDPRGHRRRSRCGDPLSHGRDRAARLRASLGRRALLDMYRGRLPIGVAGGFDWVDARDVAIGAIASETWGRRASVISYRGTGRRCGSCSRHAGGDRSSGVRGSMRRCGSRCGACRSLRPTRSSRDRRPLYTAAELRTLTQHRHCTTQRPAASSASRPVRSDRRSWTRSPSSSRRACSIETRARTSFREAFVDARPRMSASSRRTGCLLGLHRLRRALVPLSPVRDRAVRQASCARDGARRSARRWAGSSWRPRRR